MNNFPQVHENLKSNPTTHAQHFTSPQQFADQAHRLFTDTAPEEMLARKGNSYTGCFADSTEFTGYVDGYTHRDNIFSRRCNEEVRARVHASTIELNHGTTGQQDQQVLDIYHDEEGLFLDSNAYYNGDEFNMVSMQQQPQTKPIVYLAVCIGAVWSWENKHFQNRGIATIRAVHALERQGVSVGVLGYSVALVDSNYGLKEQRAVMTIVIKAPEQALDESDLINTLTNCTTLRTLGFQNRLYLIDDKSDDVGASKTLTKNDLKHAGLGDTELAILAYKHDDAAHYETVEKASKLLTASINKQTSINI
jgi:hypothetical protein